MGTRNQLEVRDSEPNEALATPRWFPGAQSTISVLRFTNSLAYDLPRELGPLPWVALLA